MNNPFFSNKLIDIINRGYIPKKLYNNEQLKLYHIYWNQSDNVKFKVYDTDIIDSIEYYYIKNIKENLYSVYTYPINTECLWELIDDFKHIKKQNIINSTHSYSGIEIKYWFTINRVKFPEKYKSKTTLNNIDDNIFYFLKRDKENNYILKRDKFKKIFS